MNHGTGFCTGLEDSWSKWIGSTDKNVAHNVMEESQMRMFHFFIFFCCCFTGNRVKCFGWWLGWNDNDDQNDDVDDEYYQNNAIGK